MNRILIAGIGNIFYRDDGFGCEVIRELRRRHFPAAVTFMDLGIRSYDLAYALTEGYDVTILVNALPRGEKPGIVYLIEPDLTRLGELDMTAVDAHSMNPVAVLRMAQSIGKLGGKLFLVGCEPAELEADNGELALSGPVRTALPHAVKLIESLVAELLSENKTERELVLN